MYRWSFRIPPWRRAGSPSASRTALRPITGRFPFRPHLMEMVIELASPPYQLTAVQRWKTSLCGHSPCDRLCLGLEGVIYNYIWALSGSRNRWNCMVFRNEWFITILGQSLRVGIHQIGWNRAISEYSFLSFSNLVLTLRGTFPLAGRSSAPMWI